MLFIGYTMIEKIKKIYAQIPKVACKGHCSNACTHIMMSDIEHQRIINFMGYDPIRTDEEMLKILNDKAFDCISCPLLKEKRCTIYDIRPAICRIYGTTKGLRCPYGCKPTKWLKDTKAKRLIRELNNLPITEL